jgi:hypothetical protein
MEIILLVAIIVVTVTGIIIQILLRDKWKKVLPER